MDVQGFAQASPTQEPAGTQEQALFPCPAHGTHRVSTAPGLLGVSCFFSRPCCCATPQPTQVLPTFRELVASHAVMATLPAKGPSIAVPAGWMQPRQPRTPKSLLQELCVWQQMFNNEYMPTGQV